MSKWTQGSDIWYLNQPVGSEPFLGITLTLKGTFYSLAAGNTAIDFFGSDMEIEEVLRLCEGKLLKHFRKQVKEAKEALSMFKSLL